jgi:two-component system sensor histidine kinase ChvG
VGRHAGDGLPVEGDLAADVSAVVAEFRPRFETADVAIEVELPETPLRVRRDRTAIRTVIYNLVDNARSFSPHGANVRLAIRPSRGEPWGPDDRDGRPGVEIVVDDDGPGIPAHAFERIFERFYTDRPEQGFGQNSGLGLSISRQIVEAHRGVIRAANRPKRGGDEVAGARFTVWLPCASTAESRAKRS